MNNEEGNMIDAGVIKQMANEKGAPLCGIAPVDRFEKAPAGFHPRDIYPGCKSVVVVASPFPAIFVEKFALLMLE
jgi:epoxyqueuosine reductase QueG